MPGLKVCGLLPGDDVSFCVNSAVTHAGFVFVPASRRYVTPQQAGELIHEVGTHANSIGVFVNADECTVLDTVRTAGLNGVQLHGAESPEFCSHIRTNGQCTVWKAVSVPPRLNVSEFAQSLAAFEGSIDAVLLDTAPPKNAGAVTGGHGARFDWAQLPQLNDALRTAGASFPIWIAGGITPENVGELLAIFQPDGVDVSSGVEERGRKSLTRINAMMKAVNQS